MTNAPVHVRTTCRLCGSGRIVRAVPLASVPIISPNVGDQGEAARAGFALETAPLDNYLCEDCGLIQLVHVVDPQLIYRDYLYRTAISKGLAEHFQSLATAVVERSGLAPGRLVVEFGSNDGTLLGFFKQAGMTVQGIDPATAIAAEASERGIPTLPDFFGPELADRIIAEQGPAGAIISNNCMANIDDLDAILAGVAHLLADDGVFVFETQYALEVFERFLLDVIYHEHISCFSVRPVAESLPRHGLQVIDAEPIDTKGGSIRFWVQKTGGPRPVSPRVAAMIEAEVKGGLYDRGYLGRFGEKVETLRRNLHAVIDSVRASGGMVSAYGTSVGCAALIHQLELQNRIDCLFDDTPFKDHLSGTGYNLPVHRGSDLAQIAPALVVVLAWRYVDGIVARQVEFSHAGGRFIVPLPELREIRV